MEHLTELTECNHSSKTDPVKFPNHALLIHILQKISSLQNDIQEHFSLSLFGGYLKSETYHT